MIKRRDDRHQKGHGSDLNPERCSEVEASVHGTRAVAPELLGHPCWRFLNFSLNISDFVTTDIAGSCPKVSS